MEGARPRQRLGTGPVTGPLERPSQGAPENRKASHRQDVEYRKPQRVVLRSARRAHSSILAAEMQLLVAAQRDERHRALAAIDAGLRSQHASQTAAVIARYAGRRAALAQIAEPTTRAAAAHRLAAEETAELASLALEHAAEKRRTKNSVLSSLIPSHRAARRALRQHQRRQRMATAVRLQGLQPQPKPKTQHAPLLSKRHTRPWRRPSGRA